MEWLSDDEFREEDSDAGYFDLGSSDEEFSEEESSEEESTEPLVKWPRKILGQSLEGRT